ERQQRNGCDARALGHHPETVSQVLKEIRHVRCLLRRSTDSASALQISFHTRAAPAKAGLPASRTTQTLQWGRSVLGQASSQERAHRTRSNEPRHRKEKLPTAP